MLPLSQEQWEAFVQRALQITGRRGQPGRFSRRLVLTTESAQHDVDRALSILNSLASRAARLILEQWKEQGPRILLDTVPNLLNPSIGLGSLNPTGISMAECFPEFCTLIADTEDLAVLLDLAHKESVVMGAAAQQPPPGSRWGFSPDGRRMWAYYLPGTLNDLLACESQLGIHLSPQMRQMYLRVWGAPSDLICPYFYRPDELEKGALYVDLYCEIANHVPVTEEVIGRQQAFVTLHNTPVGDAVGFFADDGGHDQRRENSISLWNHETAEFEPWTPDFASMVSRFITDW